MLTIFKTNNHFISTTIIRVALIGGIITRLICLRQSDLKALIAYSSVGHIGILVAGAISNSKLGLYGRLGIIIAHGLRSSALFCIANIRYEIFHTRRITITKGVLSVLPRISIL